MEITNLLLLLIEEDGAGRSWALAKSKFPRGEEENIENLPAAEERKKEIEMFFIEKMFLEEHRTNDVFILPSSSSEEHPKSKKTLKAFKTKTFGENGGLIAIRKGKFNKKTKKRDEKEHALTEKETRRLKQEVKASYEEWEDEKQRRTILGNFEEWEGISDKEKKQNAAYFTDSSMILSAIRAAKNESSPLLEMVSKLNEEDCANLDSGFLMEEDFLMMRYSLEAARNVLKGNKHAVHQIECSLVILNSNYAEMDDCSSLVAQEVFN